jgi:hypothetical protein
MRVLTFKMCFLQSFMLVETMPTSLSTSPNMGHVPMKPTRGGSSSSRLDVNGAMLRIFTSIC